VNEVKRCAGISTEPDNIAGVVRDLGFK
jgi:hypothetical protein